VPAKSCGLNRISPEIGAWEAAAEAPVGWSGTQRLGQGRPPFDSAKPKGQTDGTRCNLAEKGGVEGELVVDREAGSLQVDRPAS
jgi:hypothetical protein